MKRLVEEYEFIGYRKDAIPYYDGCDEEAGMNEYTFRFLNEDNKELNLRISNSDLRAVSYLLREGVYRER